MSNPSFNVLVTGSNRGIGLELCRQLLARGARVIAACRSSSPELDALAGDALRIVPHIDVGSAAGATALADAIDGVELDLAIMNAGILLRGDKPAEPDFDGLREQLEVNAVGTLRCAVAVVPRLRSGGKLAFITSRMGSIGDNTSGSYYGYRMSKAALNMAAVSLAKDLAPRGVSVAILHPGMVKTDMTRGHGQVDVDVAAAGLLARIDELTPATSGTFRHANGEALPW